MNDDADQKSFKGSLQRSFPQKLSGPPLVRPTNYILEPDQDSLALANRTFIFRSIGARIQSHPPYDTAKGQVTATLTSCCVRSLRARTGFLLNAIILVMPRKPGPGGSLKRFEQFACRVRRA